MRECMTLQRKKKGVSIETMAKRCKCSVILLEMLEYDEDAVTHPNIAARIAKAYGLNAKDAERLLPEIRRPSSPLYDPHKYEEKAEED